MSWGDFFGVVGGAAAGGLRAYQDERDYEQKERLTRLQNQTRILMQAATIADRQERQQFLLEHQKELNDVNNKTKKEIQDSKNTTAIKVGADKNETAVTVGGNHDAASRYGADKRLEGTEYGADSRLEGEKYGADSRLTGTRYNADKRLQGTQYGADKQLEGQTYSANMRYSADTDTANIREDGQNYRADADRPLRIFRANQGRYPRGSAAARRAGSISQPVFGPSYSEFMQQGGGGIPGPMMPDQFNTPSPTPNMSPAPPKAPSIFDTPRLELPPPIDTSVGPETEKPSLDSSGFVGFKSPEAGGRSAMTEERLEQQANDLMARITQAQQAGKFEQVNALKQQLADLIKQHQ